MKRPQGKSGSQFTTPLAESMTRILGPGMVTGGTIFTRDETAALNKLYAFKPEGPGKRPPKPVRQPDPEGALPHQKRDADEAFMKKVAAWERWEDPQALMQAGADRNMVRHATSDGLRLVAWIAKFVPEGEDPVKTLIQLASQAGWDVSGEDMAWAEDEALSDLEDAG